MLTRYRIVRGARPPAEPLPDGIRQDTRKHTAHCLAPSKALVARFLDHPSDATFSTFRDAYLALLARRFEDDRSPFDRVAELAQHSDVYLGCNCPTKNQPDVARCHTVLALGFLKGKYPDLDVRLP